MPSLSATFHLTHACNLRCDYCYTGEKVGRHMSDSTATRSVDFVLAEAAKEGADSVEVVFFGGEPLLQKDLLLWIVETIGARAGRVRTSFKTSTNGLLLDRPLIDALARHRVYVSLSIDGAPDIQDTQRLDVLGQGTSKRLAEIVPDVLAVNPCTNVTMVVTPSSAAVVDHSVAWLFERGFRYISIALEQGADWSQSDLKQLEKSYRRLAKWYVARTRAKQKLYLSCFDEKINSRTRGPLDAAERCELGIRQFSIAPSGRLYPCVQFVNEDEDTTFAIGHVDTGFDQEHRTHVHATSETEKDECGGCALKSRCASWCACSNWRATGRIDRASALTCQHEQILMPIADGVANELWRRRNRLFIHKHYNPAFPVLSFIEDMVVEESEQ